MEIFASYSGFDFLVFYFMMLITCVFVGLWIPANLRPEGTRADLTEVQDIALLSGGKERHATALMAQLYAQGGLAEAENKRLRVAQTDLDVSEAERSILRELGALKLSHIKKTLHAEALRVEAGLIKRGLLMDQGQRLQLRVLSTLPYIVLFAIGFYRQQAGAAIGESTGFLIILLCLTALAGLIRAVRLNARTMMGNVAMRDLEEGSSRLKRAPQAAEAGYAVAIFGTGVLVGTPWEPVHATRQAAYGGAGGDTGDHSDSGGDSGCGGGGCGGCGG